MISCTVCGGRGEVEAGITGDVVEYGPTYLLDTTGAEILFLRAPAIPVPSPPIRSPGTSVTALSGCSR